MRTWTYEEITKKAEERIEGLMVKARDINNDIERRLLYTTWAYGVFLGWKDLTMGWMDDGDCERLEGVTIHQKKERIKS